MKTVDEITNKVNEILKIIEGLDDGINEALKVGDQFKHSILKQERLKEAEKITILAWVLS